MDRQTAFLEFKALPEEQQGGKVFEEQIITNRNDLKDRKLLVRQFTDGCNLAKRELDQIKSKLDAKAEEKRITMRQDMMENYQDEDEEGLEGAGAAGAQEIIDEEELALLQKMKELKRIYRENFEKLRESKAQVFYIQQSIDSLKQSLVGAFEDWYTQNFDDGEDLMSSLVRMA